VLVSSGAVASGLPALGLDGAQRPRDARTLQAISAVGQARLMQTWNESLGAHGIVAGQVLLAPHDFMVRAQYLQARGTLDRLVELGVVPVVNENDAVADDEIRFGDNDRIAALVAHSMKADVLVLLTDLDGLYTSDPRFAPDAELVADVAADDPLLSIRADAGGSGRGSGGMASKLAAARIASWSGVRTVIANASRDGVLPEAVDGAAAGTAVGTTFAGHDRRLPARKLWIAFAAEVRGTVVVDDGARQALTRRSTSLLPAGVRDVIGSFGEGDTVDVRSTDGTVFARGMVFVTAADLRAVAGMQTRDLPDGMVHEVIHRDDLVVLAN